MFFDVYIIISNREAGEGRFDIQLEPRDKSKPGYLLEFKNSKLNRENTFDFIILINFIVNFRMFCR